MTKWRSTPAACEAECATMPMVSIPRSLPLSKNLPDDSTARNANVLVHRAEHSHGFYTKEPTQENPKLCHLEDDEQKKEAKELLVDQIKLMKMEKQKQEDEDLKRYPSLLLVLLRVFWRTLLKAHLCKLAQDLVHYMNPVWLGYAKHQGRRQDFGLGEHSAKNYSTKSF